MSQQARSTAFGKLNKTLQLNDSSEFCWLSMQVGINRTYLHNSDICQNVGGHHLEAASS